MNEVTNRISVGGNFSGSIEERSLLYLADGSQISNCSLPCTTHQIYAWLTHRSKKRGAPKTTSKGDCGRRDEEGLKDGDRMEGVEKSKKDKKKEQEEIVTVSKDDIRVEEDHLIDGDQMDEIEKSNASPKKDKNSRQEITLIFAEQVINDKIVQKVVNSTDWLLFRLE